MPRALFQRMCSTIEFKGKFKLLTAATKIKSINEARSFHGCVLVLGLSTLAVDNFPVSLEGPFKGRPSKPSVVLELIAKGELWI